MFTQCRLTNWVTKSLYWNQLSIGVSIKMTIFQWIIKDLDEELQSHREIHLESNTCRLMQKWLYPKIRKKIHRRRNLNQSFALASNENKLWRKLLIYRARARSGTFCWLRILMRFHNEFTMIVCTFFENSKFRWISHFLFCRFFCLSFEIR